MTASLAPSSWTLPTQQKTRGEHYAIIIKQTHANPGAVVQNNKAKAENIREHQGTILEPQENITDHSWWTFHMTASPPSDCESIKLITPNMDRLLHISNPSQGSPPCFCTHQFQVKSSVIRTDSQKSGRLFCQMLKDLRSISGK